VNAWKGTGPPYRETPLHNKATGQQQTRYYHPYTLYPTPHLLALADRRELFERLLQYRTEHSYLREYYQRFVLSADLVCPCGKPIQTQEHVICKKAKLQARIKPTALCSAIDKENLIEFLLDLLYYIYNYYCGYIPCLPWSSCYLSADFFVTCCDCDYDSMWCDLLWPLCDIFPYSTLVII